MSTEADSRLVVFFDLETTGLDCNKDEIIEFAAIVYKDGREFSSLVKLQKLQRVPREATDIHGIQTEDLVGDEVPSFAAMFAAFLAWVEADKQQILLVAHNCYEFDRLMLKAACKRDGITLPKNIVFSDSLIALRRMKTIKKCESYALSKLAAVWCPTTKQEHRALSDVRLLTELIHGRGEDAIKEFYSLLVDARQPKWP